MNLTLAYHPTNSGIHRLNPFVMLAWLGATVGSTLVVQHPIWLVAVFLTTVPVAYAARVVEQWTALMKLMLWMGVAIVCINLLVSQQGTHVFLEAGFRLPLLGVPRMTGEAALFGFGMALRLGSIISAFTILNLSVHPDDLLRAAVKLRLPYRSVLVTSLSTRFIPVLLADARTISDVQQSRGLAFDRGTIVQRIRSRGALIFPLLSNSLDRAVQVAEAMEARAYGASTRRTFYRDTPMVSADVVMVLVLCGALLLAVVARGFGFGSFEYYPTLGNLGMTPVMWGTLALLCGMLLSVLVPNVSRRRNSNDSV